MRYLFYQKGAIYVTSGLNKNISPVKAEENAMAGISASSSVLEEIRKCPDMKLLIDLGAKGHFPLFYSKWIADSLPFAVACKKDRRSLLQQNRCKLKTIFKRLAKHKSIVRKRTVLLSLDESDRRLFINTFINLVEARILDCCPQMH